MFNVQSLYKNNIHVTYKHILYYSIVLKCLTLDLSNRISKVALMDWLSVGQFE